MPPCGAWPSSRAAMLTPSPKMSSPSMTMSPRLMPMRNSNGGSAARLRSRHRALDRDGALDRVDDAAELDQRAIAHHLDDAAVARRDGRVERLAPDLPQRGERAGLVGAHHAAVADDVGGEDRGKPSRDLLFRHTGILAAGIFQACVELPSCQTITE